jgi:hypothetical protein
MMGSVDRFYGWSYHFSNGFSIGFNWIHGNGRTSKSSAVIAAYHHPNSITWRWALEWVKPKGLLPLFRAWGNKSYGSVSFYLPVFGGFYLRWQQHMMLKQKGGAL